jgi:hypothetical protein
MEMADVAGFRCSCSGKRKSMKLRDKATKSSMREYYSETNERGKSRCFLLLCLFYDNVTNSLGNFEPCGCGILKIDMIDLKIY